MEFNPNNPIVMLCIQGMELEEKGKPMEAARLFLEAWNEATNDLEKFLAAFYVARQQMDVARKLSWLESALQFAMILSDESVKAALPGLYTDIANCYKDLGDHDKAKKHYDLATSFKDQPADKGPFYHGTKADLEVGDLLIAGGSSNYKPELKMNHVYFTALVNGAGLAAALAKGNGPERVYIVEPTGEFENDPNVTNKKFPGNPTRSYRTRAPLRIIGKVREWVRQTPEQIEKWRKKLAHVKGDIIN